MFAPSAGAEAKTAAYSSSARASFAKAVSVTLVEHEKFDAIARFRVLIAKQANWVSPGSKGIVELAVFCSPTSALIKPQAEGSMLGKNMACCSKAVRQRVHISEEYEKKIDRIEDRLSGIENVLERLAFKLGDLDLQNDSKEPSSESRPSRIGSRVGTMRSPTRMTEETSPAPFEGETAINSQSGYARELLTKIVGNTPSIGQNEELKSALNALGDIVTRQGHVTVSTTSSTNSLINRALSDVDPGKLDRPPWLEVKDMLDKALKNQSMPFAIIFPFLKMRNIYEIFEDAYQDPAHCGAPRRILAYGMGYNLFTEFSAMPSCTGLDRNRLQGYATLCKHHMEVAISQLDAFIPASYENVMALVLGAACAIEMCKPSLAWILTAMAASQSQNLGYHRYQTFQNDDEEERNSKIHLFWMIYMYDKQLSLRLGRASVIQDWDMSLPLITPTPSTAKLAFGGSQMLSYWIKVAKVQGKTYKKLFSPAAFLRSPEERLSTAIDLISALNQAWYERGEATIMDFAHLTTAEGFAKRGKMAMASPNETELPSQRSFERVEDVFFHADVVMHYSTCALIQRAVSSDSGTFSQECLGYARAALIAHERCNAQFNTNGNEELWAGYIHWSILQAPFTPFIVVFCNAIQTADLVDLGTLQQFVASLESCRTVSEGADRLYKMCHLFLQVAKLYIQAKKNDSKEAVSQPSPSTFYPAQNEFQLDSSTMTQFDPYLSALGLVPNSSWPMSDYADASIIPTAMASFSNVQHAANTQGEASSMAYAPNGVLQNSVQDWFSGSRYLMNLMEAGDDMQMPDLNDFDIQLTHVLSSIHAIEHDQGCVPKLWPVIMVRQSQLLLLLPAPVLSRAITNCTASALPTPSVFGASVLTLDAFESTLESTSISFCNVTLTYTHPGQNDLIKVWLGLPASWNGRFQGAGGGGWVTGFPSQIVPAIAEGYAAVATDGGHDGLGQTTESWALLSPGNVNLYALQNFASVTLNDMTVLGKQLTEAYYGKTISKSYWLGCSTGGRQGLMLAQHYPDAYDGILAQAPAVHWTELIFTRFWPQWIMQTVEYFPPDCELSAITAAAVSACDEDDGLKDGVIGLPNQCTFDPDTVVGLPYACGTVNGTISKEAAEIVKSIWKGATDAEGKAQWPILSPGSSLSAMAGTKCDSSGHNCTGAPFPVADEWHRLFVKKDPTFDPYNYTQAEWDAAFHASVQQYNSIIGTSDPDLSEFKRLGGKMITGHGLADEAIPFEGIVKYYERVLALDANATDFYRIYGAPGVGHCGGGLGATPVDHLAPLIAWVEEGKAPDEFAAVRIVNGSTWHQNLVPGFLQQQQDTIGRYHGVQHPPPPAPESFEVSELPLPPVAPSREVGACSIAINPRRTGCIARDLQTQKFQSGDFTPDGAHVIVNAERTEQTSATATPGSALVAQFQPPTLATSSLSEITPTCFETAPGQSGAGTYSTATASSWAVRHARLIAHTSTPSTGQTRTKSLENCAFTRTTRTLAGVPSPRAANSHTSDVSRSTPLQPPPDTISSTSTSS
ncbi:hypothetical protein OPT61_g1688 [Boeremia exigua]|uniref:Uncharacterized protein n=1 Tax=Boeremia exigua TaxID=749465 RepID=A0ACC2IP82_9PLEO|nr:hypothetical protein OPT61_g1688 [Boeremia exigua]